MDRAVEQWIQDNNYIELKNLIEGRKVAVWGAYGNGRAIRAAVERRGITVSTFVDSNREEAEYCGLPIIRPSELNKLNYYVIIAVLGKRQEILDYLQLHQMEERIDFCYGYQSCSEILLGEVENEYFDENGNHIVCDGKLTAQIRLIGCNNEVVIGRSVRIGKDLEIVCRHGSTLRLGDYLICGNRVFFDLYDSSIVSLGNNVTVGADSVVRCYRNKLSIGDNTSIGTNFVCINSRLSSTSIGKDCMISHMVSLISGGGHTVLDLCEKKSVNCEEGQYVNIGDHVWLGIKATVLSNTQIGRGSIVGANSLVKGHFGANCSLGGNPAHILHENRTWDRREGASYEDAFGI